MENSLTIVIPAYNEEESINKFLPDVISFCYNNNFKLIVVNDGSIDKTKEILKNYNDLHGNILKVINHKVNKGYGGALKSGIQAAETNYVIRIDADGRRLLEDILKLHKEIIEKDADMIVGSRKGQKNANFYRKFGKSIIRGIAKWLMPLEIYDINSGMKIYNTELAKKYVPLCPDSMAYSDTILLIFVYQKHLVLETPITINKRIAGKSTISVSTAIETIREIMNVVVLFNPMRIFIPVSILFFVSGVTWGIPILLKGRGVSVGSGILIIMSVIIFLLSLIAEQLSQLKRKN